MMQKIAHLESQREIAQFMQPVRSLEVVARSALRQLAQLVPCRQASIVKFELEAGMATVLATCALGEPLGSKGNCLPLEVLALTPEIWQGKVHWVEDLSAFSNPSRAIQALQAEGVRSYLNVPVIAQTEGDRPAKAPVLGCINLGADTPNAFTPEHVNLVCEAANMVAVAIGQAILCKQMQRRIDELEDRLAERTGIETGLISSLEAANEQLQQEVTERQQLETVLHRQRERERLKESLFAHIHHSSSLREFLNTTVAEVRDLLQADRVLVYRFAEQKPGSVIVESVAPHCTSMQGFVLREPCVSQEKYLKRYQQGRIEAIEDISAANLEPAHNEFLDFFSIKSMLVVPLLQDDPGFSLLNCELNSSQTQNLKKSNKLWGLLIVHQCSTPRKWQTFEIDLVASLTTQVASAIEQFQLFDKVQGLNADLLRQVEERNEQLQQALEYEAMLQRITDKVCDSLDENQILQTAVQELAQVLGVEECNSAVYSAQQTPLPICQKFTTSLPSSPRFRPIADFPEVYAQLLRCEHFQFCDAFPKTSTDQGGILACPIFHNEQVLGDLWLFRQQDDRFNELEIRLVQVVANHCAIAMRQARLYQAAQAQVTQLAKLNHLKDDFLSTVSHELRTPLSNMKMAIQMLAIALNQETGFFAELTKPEAERSKVARYFQIVRNESEREIRLINDLLELQQLDAGSQAWAPAIIHLQRLLPQILQTFEEKTQNCRQVLELNMPPDMPDLVGDPAILSRILAELLTNACKYTPSGEKIIVKVGTIGDRVQFSVTNTGVEIPAEELTHIFKKFYRIPKADQWQQGGTGLGLAVVQKLTERLGGTIEVKSDAGETCFTLDLPINSPGKV